jgi:hypothetical protein
MWVLLVLLDAASQRFQFIDSVINDTGELFQKVSILLISLLFLLDILRLNLPQTGILLVECVDIFKTVFISLQIDP